ncbi:phosphodiesterase/alkaline phosphatase D [Xenococcus sp. PCC 7305]|uniref:alkaline phosphatase D family protein n=1 Tax=Xenococcus sp. PCC 7305 TaxID=102125 RepID=UPI0002ABA350|nr:alkaline phosphatase D family protein [Xenococcus sp. PCC 7305]ELS05305.1 phosphodiesterase/alkaline phosphatase D [Xenococcus sp. PCC 7305]
MNIIKKLTVGPIVGHADTNHVRIWGRAIYQPLASNKPRRTFGVARIRKKDGGSYGAPRVFKMNPNFDMSGVIVFTNLEPNTKYTYQIGWFFSDKEPDEIRSSEKWDWHDADRGEFQTASEDPNQAKTFVFGSCRYLLRLLNESWFDDRGDKTFRSILKQVEEGRALDKFLMVGDQIYADDLNVLAPDKKIEEYLARYRDAFSQPYLKTLMGNISTYMTLDDHEIEDNWPSSATPKDMTVKFPAAMHSYRIYQMSHSPLLPISDTGKLMGTPEKYYYSFLDGCCDFFVTDTRTERDLEQQKIISDEQMQALLSWLDNGSERVKFVVTSVPFFPDIKKTNSDKWSGFKQQRDQIISLIRDRKIPKVVFLGGDVHCSMAAELDISKPGEDSWKIYSIISSAFFWPYSHMKASQFNLTGSVPSLDNENAYSLGKVSQVYSGDNFSRVSVSHEQIAIEVYERKGELMHSIQYQF